MAAVPVQASINAHIADARERLRAAGIDDNEVALDARLLAQHVLGWDAVRLLTDGGDTAPAGFAHEFRAAIERRVHREPLAYITGTREFWGLEFEVTRDVLVPRPETEILVETALRLVPAGDPRRILDVCTGSGCVAVAIAHKRPLCRLTAADISAAALAVATRNAGRHGVTRRIEFVQADLLIGIDTRFDMIVSNPPYVATADRDTLQPEVRRFEPGLALFAGIAGLDAIERLAAQAPARLRPGGRLLFEFGLGQARAIAELLSAAPALTMEPFVPDLQGIPRVAIARHDPDKL